MKIECPFCAETNDLDQEVSCSKCEKSLSKEGLTFAQKPLFSALSGVIFTVAGFWGYDWYMDPPEGRYPLEVEYALVNACTNGSSNGMTREEFGLQSEVCLCAVENVTRSISYADFQENKTAFGPVLERHVDECL